MTRIARDGVAALLELALAGPAVLCLAATVLGLGAVAAGHAATTASALTTSEAAALRDRADLLRLIGAGADPRARARVRAGIIRDREYLLTPLEAAVATRRDDVVRLLVNQGVPLDDATFPVVYCLAARSDFEQMTALLRELAPARELPPCDDVRLPL